MMLMNPYQAYEQGSVLASQNPLQLVIALYEGAISAVQEGIRCLEARDIMARAKAINKAHNILAELDFSLKRDSAETRALSSNLSGLYGYMQKRVLEAHLQQAEEPLAEVEGLLRTMLDGWYVVAQKEEASVRTDAHLLGYSEPALSVGDADVLGVSYGGYYHEPLESFSPLAFSF